MHRTIEDLFPKINQEDGIVAKQQEYYFFLKKSAIAIAIRRMD